MSDYLDGDGFAPVAVAPPSPRASQKRTLLAAGHVRQQRRDCGLSQDELGSAQACIEITSGIERGERNVRVKALLALARGLGTKPSAVLPH
jgi:hypothetical protein